MFEQQPAALRQRVEHLANAALRQSDPSAWFDILYAEAQGDPALIPWAKLTPHPYLQSWLAAQPTPPPQTKALVIGCGLGDDAEALQAHGYDVTAFDVSKTAIAWSQRRFPESAVAYQAANLFDLPAPWQHQFEFVYECRNLQALPLDVRLEAVAAVATLVAPQGTLLVITRVRTDGTTPTGPPWPLSATELSGFSDHHLQEMERAIYIDRALVPPTQPMAQTSGQLVEHRLVYQSTA